MTNAINTDVRMQVCEYCGEELTVEENFTYQDDVCDMCTTSNFTLCDNCGEWVEDDLITYLPNERASVCEACLEYDYIFCDRCDSYVSEMHYDYDKEMCCDCADDYVYCEGCGELIHVDDSWRRSGDGSYFCEGCFPDNSDTINAWNYKPSPIFHGQGPLYLGLEVEIDKPTDADYYSIDIQAAAEAVLEEAAPDSIYLKEDGSLNHGFEIVTHPCSYNYHKNELGWGRICTTAVHHGLRSHDTETCGLHIHLSRAGLGDHRDSQDLTIAKMMLLVDTYWDNLIVPFSRRNVYRIDRWAKKPNARILTDDSPTEASYKARMAGGHDRYTAINLCNTNTIEFRIFRGSLVPSTILAAMEFCLVLVDYCRSTPLNNLMDKDLTDVLAGAGYAELKKYMIDRKIITEDQ